MSHANEDNDDDPLPVSQQDPPSQSSSSVPFPALNSEGHVSHCMRCLDDLLASLVEMDASRMAIGFYCLGTFDVTGFAERKITKSGR
ncbi:hypothetical protein BGW80DRAFT_1358282, partial [Lactifluus volemus]